VTLLLPRSSTRRAAALPVLLSVPHSGRDYPDWLVEWRRAAGAALDDARGPAGRPAGVAGAGARHRRGHRPAPRAAIDCNRAEDEVDPAVIAGARRAGQRRGPAAGSASSRRAPISTAICGGGRSTAPSSTSGSTRRTALSSARRGPELAAARPLRLRAAARLPFDAAAAAPARPPIVFGDRHGRTAAPWLSGEAVAHRPGGWLRGRAQRPVMPAAMSSSATARPARRPCAADRDRPSLLSRPRAAQPGPGLRPVAR
jgi:hypothetical protein